MRSFNAGSRTCSSVRWAVHPRRPALLRQLSLPGPNLEPVTPGRGQGRVASWRTLPTGGLPGDQPVPSGWAGGGLLQSTRHGGAVDPRGQERGPVDTPVVPFDEGQRGPSSASCAGVQPGQLLSHAGSAGRGGALVSDHASGEGGQDWCEGDHSRPLYRVPDGRGGGPARPVPPHPGDDRGSPTKADSAMLNPPAAAPATTPDGRGAPEVSLDAQTWCGRAGTTGNLGRFRHGTGLLGLFGGGGRSYSTHERTRMSRLPGECRITSCAARCLSSAHDGPSGPWCLTRKRSRQSKGIR